VNERDVLNYLGGVMLGSQPVDPTPEPLPEGMTAWTEESARSSVQIQPKAAGNLVDVTTPKAAAPNSASAATYTEPSTETDHPAENLEDTYRELFAELAVLKKAAEAVEEAREKERESAAQTYAEAQQEPSQVRETLRNRDAELTELRAHTADLEAGVRTREQRDREVQLELEHLRGTVHSQDEELVEVHSLKQQLRDAETQERARQSLSAQLAKADAKAQQAQSDADGLRAANAGLERRIAELNDEASRLKVEPEKRPWWKLWG